MINLDKIILVRVKSGRYSGAWEAKAGNLRAYGDSSFEALGALLEKAAA